MNDYYENHEELRKNKFCPFKLFHAFLGGTVGCNWHKNIEILLITEGECFIQYSADTFPLHQNDMVIANSNVLHRLYTQTGTRFFCLIIDNLFCSENGINIEEICFEKIVTDEGARRLFEDVTVCAKTYEETKTDLSAAVFRSAVLTLLVYLYAHHSAPTEAGNSQTSSERHVKLALKYLHENFTHPITLDTLAALCGITKFHLARQFKQYTGQTVFSYLNHLRCKNAELLIAEGSSITEAAYASGFESISYFSRTYKKHMGASPSSKI